MRRVVVASILALMLTAFATPAAASPVNPVQLQAAGWTCFNVPGLGVHCVSPASAFPPSGEAVVPLLYFDTSNPDDASARLVGQETLIREDLFHGAQCPYQPGGAFTLTFGAYTYYACHHS